MLEMSDQALAVVQRSFTMVVRAESWRSGELLADNIPVSDGSEEADRSVNVPETVTLNIPRRDRGFNWDPGSDPDHPLAAYGQQLRISYGVDLGNGDFEWIDRGWFLITDSSADGDTVSVTCHGLLTLIDEAKFVSPFQPKATDTLASTTRALVEPALTVVFDGTLVDRPVTAGMQWDSDRMQALNDVLDAWAAESRVTVDGYLLVEPVVDVGTPVLALTDGQGGTVMRWQGSTTRDGAFNVVVSQGEDADGNQIIGTAYDLSSPFRFGGPFNPLPVPYFNQSDLLTTVDQCRKNAAATLIQKRRSADRKLEVTMVPHPGIQFGDTITATSDDLDGVPCTVEAYSLPYSPGQMTTTIRVPFS
jgi:hypothetical protein